MMLANSSSRTVSSLVTFTPSPPIPQPPSPRRSGGRGLSAPPRPCSPPLNSGEGSGGAAFLLLRELRLALGDGVDVGGVDDLGTGVVAERLEPGRGLHVDQG